MFVLRFVGFVLFDLGFCFADWFVGCLGRIFDLMFLGWVARLVVWWVWFGCFIDLSWV